jgi:hypothetical protein
MAVRAFNQKNAAGSSPAVSINPVYESTVDIQVEGLSADGVALEVTQDKSNWYAVSVAPVGGGSAVTSIVADGVYSASLRGKQWRLTKTGTTDTIDAWVTERLSGRG